MIWTKEHSIDVARLILKYPTRYSRFAALVETAARDLQFSSLEYALGGVARAGRAQHHVGILLEKAGPNEAFLGQPFWRFESLSRPNDILWRRHREYIV